MQHVMWERLVKKAPARVIPTTGTPQQRTVEAAAQPRGVHAARVSVKICLPATMTTVQRLLLLLAIELLLVPSAYSLRVPWRSHTVCKKNLPSDAVVGSVVDVEGVYTFVPGVQQGALSDQPHLHERPLCRAAPTSRHSCSGPAASCKPPGAHAASWSCSSQFWLNTSPKLLRQLLLSQSFTAAATVWNRTHMSELQFPCRLPGPWRLPGLSTYQKQLWQAAHQHQRASH